MIAPPVSYKRHRFPRELIAHAVWLYHRFPLSLRLVEEMLLERRIVVFYEAIRRWGSKFGPAYVRRLRRKPTRPGDIWHLDEVRIVIAADPTGCGARSISMAMGWTRSCRPGAIRKRPNA